MARTGRPPWVPTPENIKQVEGYAAMGMTQEQIADALGICNDTLIRKKKIYSEFNDALKRGKAKGISIIANKLFTDGKEGNTTAQIFFLKSRAGWKETSVSEMTGPDGKPIQIHSTGKVDLIIDFGTDPEKPQ